MISITTTSRQAIPVQRPEIDQSVYTATLSPRHQRVNAELKRKRQQHHNLHFRLAGLATSSVVNAQSDPTVRKHRSCDDLLHITPKLQADMQLNGQQKANTCYGTEAI